MYSTKAWHASVSNKQGKRILLQSPAGRKGAFDTQCQKCFCVTFGESNKATAKTSLFEWLEKVIVEERKMRLERTISGMMGKGSVQHNTRAFSAKNVDKERSKDNVEFCNKNIKDVYHELFDGALERYNAKQKRSDRKIDNYYEKIRQGKQEKLFHEVIFQIGNKDDMNARSEDGQLAKQILTEFMKDFQRRNPNLYVFSAHLHMDEETPHLHIDFVPFIQNSKRGLDTRVSLKGALAEMGFKGGTRGATEWNQWIESEKKELAIVMQHYDIQWLQKGTHNKHLSVLDYEKQEREKEVAELTEEKQQLEVGMKQLIQKQEVLEADNEQLLLEQKKLEKELRKMADSKVLLERNVRAYDEDEKWQLPEIGAFMSAKNYRDNRVAPLVSELKKLVKGLTIQCINAIEKEKQLRAKVDKLTEDVVFYKEKMIDNHQKINELEKKAEDLEYVKKCIGADKIDSLVVNARRAKKTMQKGQIHQYSKKLSR